MKRLLASSCAALALLWGQAEAAPAIITGGGTGGALGSNAQSSALTTVAMTTTGADVPIGSLVVVGSEVRGSQTASPCTDSAGNTYSTPVVTLNGFTIATCQSFTTHDLPIGSMITFAWSATAGNKAISAVAFSGMSATPHDPASAAATGSTAGVIAGPTTGTLQSSEVLVAFIGYSNTGITEDTTNGWTSLITTTTAVSHMAYQITSGATTKQYAPNLTGTAAAWQAQIQAYYPAGFPPAATSNKSFPLMGVGQ